MQHLSVKLFAAIFLLLTAQLGCKPTDFSGSAGKKDTSPNGSKSKDRKPAKRPGDNGDTLGNVGDSDDKSSGGTTSGLDEDSDNAGKKPEDDLETDSGQKKKCVDENLKTNVKLLTLTVANGAPGNKVSYEISIVDCNGDRNPVTGKNILFDIDAQVDDVIENSYVAKVGLETVSGTLNVVDNVDLFGKTGPEYFHHRTDKTISLTSTVSSVILTIDLRGQKFFPLNGGDNGSFLVNTHLKFGDADPVTQPVMFIK